VYERDGVRCSFVSPDGRRCESRAFLELDHAEPRAQGGKSNAENLRVRCRAHNQLWAEDVYGRELVEEARHFRRKKWEDAQDQKLEAAASGPVETLERIRLALTTMGFPDVRARRAVAELARKHAETPTLEQGLREALAILTRAA
jgi:hypothetical protein